MSLKQVQLQVIGWGSILCLMLGAALYSNRERKKHRQSILGSPMFASGQFLELKNLGKASNYTLTGFYSFTVNFETHGGQNTDKRYKKIQAFILKKRFPVIYNSNDPTKNSILVFPDDFSNFNLPYPDSLIWVEGLIDDKDN
jgi:hypothetical protein